MYICGIFILMYGRGQHNIVKQLSSKRKKHTQHTQVLITSTAEKSYFDKAFSRSLITEHELIIFCCCNKYIEILSSTVGPVSKILFVLYNVFQDSEKGLTLVCNI